MKEHVIQPGDQIEIGPLSMTYCLTQATKDRSESPSTASVIVTDSTSTKISSVDDFETPRIRAEHLNDVAAFGQNLLGIANTDQRLEH